MPQLKTEFVDALQPAFAKIAEMEIRPSQIPAHATEIGDAMNEILTKKWSEIRGLSIVSVAFNPVTLKEEDAEAIRQAQNTSMYTDPSMMAATLGMAQAEAMKNAASNPNGAMMGFMGMNMGMQSAGGFMNNASAVNMQQMQQILQNQSESMQATQNIVEEVLSGIRSSMSGIGQIKTSTKRLDDSRSEVVEAVSALSEIAGNNVEGTKKDIR